MEFEIINGEVFANATIMCQAFGKSPKDFLKTDKMDRYLNAISVRTKIPTGKLVETKQGGTNQGTWIHEKLILKLAQWLDVDFELWCDEKIAELLRTGKVELDPISIEDVLIQQLQITKSIRLDQEQMKAKQAEQDERMLQIEAKTTTRPEYFTVVGYATLQKRKVGLALSAAIGRRATTLCNKKGYNIDKIYDPRFGEVGSYPMSVLREIFDSTTFA
jgi:hypothetical protein